ncbi:FAD-dependent monooxygenase [Streptomyces sp. NPDC053048]|uniref:FAD-dependent monooxygenase n=1 Tax=Streptomyces sp. NPDC053048 TaxID=3365694 RepID=UPI0037D22847
MSDTVGNHRPGKAVIIGAGIGGLTAAATLRRVGMDVEVYERARELRPAGTALTVMCNAVTALRTIGIDLAPELDKHGRVFRTLHFRTSTGRPIREMRFGELADRLGSTNYAVHRADLQQALLRALGDDTPVHLDSTVTGFQVNGPEATVQFADGRRVTADVLIGADGFHSAIRRGLTGPEQPSEAGYVCWLATVPFTHPRFTEGFAAHYWAPGQRFGLADIGQGRAYWWGTLNMAPSAARNWRGGKEGILRAFDGWADEVRAVIEATPEKSVVTVPAQDRPFLERWGYGPVTLLGDAAHPMLTALGQGAAMAIEDAVALAESLAGAHDLPRALRDYEARRRPRTRRMVQASRSLSRIEQLDGPLPSRLRELYFRFTPRSVFDKQNLSVLEYRAVAVS